LAKSGVRRWMRGLPWQVGHATVPAGEGGGTRGARAGAEVREGQVRRELSSEDVDGCLCSRTHKQNAALNCARATRHAPRATRHRTTARTRTCRGLRVEGAGEDVCHRTLHVLLDLHRLLLVVLQEGVEVKLRAERGWQAGDGRQEAGRGRGAGSATHAGFCTAGLNPNGSTYMGWQLAGSGPGLAQGLHAWAGSPGRMGRSRGRSRSRGGRPQSHSRGCAGNPGAAAASWCRGTAACGQGQWRVKQLSEGVQAQQHVSSARRSVAASYGQAVFCRQHIAHVACSPALPAHAPALPWRSRLT
jgi:hypothetical protein